MKISVEILWMMAVAASGPVMDMVLPTRMGWACARASEGKAARATVEPSALRKGRFYISVSCVMRSRMELGSRHRVARVAWAYRSGDYSVDRRLADQGYPVVPRYVSALVERLGAMYAGPESRYIGRVLNRTG